MAINPIPTLGTPPEEEKLPTPVAGTNGIPVLGQPPQDQQPTQPVTPAFNTNPTQYVGAQPPANLSQPTQFLTGVQQVPNPGGDPWSVGFDSVDHDPFTPQIGLYKS